MVLEDRDVKTRSKPSSRSALPRPVTVVIADDDEEFSSALSELIASRSSLKLLGAASDTEGAIELCRHQQPDVAVLDLRMPGGGGVQVARSVARECAGTRVIALSAYLDPRSVREMVDAGAVEYLVKGAHSSAEIVDAILRAAALDRE